MPSVFRRIGRDFVDKHGNTRTPRALFTWCETCNFEGASFGIAHGNAPREWYCGFVDGEPCCIGKGLTDGHGDTGETGA